MIPDFDVPGYSTAMRYAFQHTSCPNMTSMTGDYAKCELECVLDNDCPLLHYCCPNGCGRLCVPPQVNAKDDCGCSVTFLKPETSLEDSYMDFSVQNLVWEALGQSFTPTLEPYIVKGVYDFAFLGPMDSQCSFKRAIEFMKEQIPYTAFKKPTRILIILANDEKFLEDVVLAPLNVTYTTVCAVSAGNFSISESLMEQLSVIDNNQSCLWTVDSFSNLRDVAPNISAIVNAENCNCGTETIPSSPCKEEGATCEKDSECDQPTFVCMKGKCSPVTCFQQESFSPEATSDYDSYSYDYYYDYYYYYGIEGDYFTEGYFGFYQDYDYFFLQNPGGSRKMKRIKTKPYKSIVPTDGRRNGYDKLKNRKRASTRLSQLTENRLACCSWYEFQCSGVPAICISATSVCDGVSDCFYGDDETPEVCAKRICDVGWFKCGTGQCISTKQICDGIKNCPDGSDENCLSRSDCPSSRPHHCASGECIHYRKICDQVQDCNNGEDEIHCRCSGFRCSPVVCISYNKVCDGNYDCLDGSDEYCANSSCPEGQTFRCDNGNCIDNKRTCNGYDDCGDRSDEAVALCKPESCFYCDSGECVRNTTVCDGRDDCGDRSDEIYCKEFVCNKNMFHCNSGECLLASVRCNGRVECADGSDELVCDICLDDRPLLCSSGECINYLMVCNGRYDCSDRADESKCLSMSCPANNPKKCNSGLCVTYGERCYYDTEVLSTLKPICSKFVCKSGDCANRCNGYRECEDGSDEEDCEGLPCPKRKDWRCKSGECISVYSRCNGDTLCNDGSDEVDCPDYTCPKGGFKCTSGECISEYSKCNGYISCNDGSDEQDCSTNTCTGAFKLCKSGECVYKFEFCDGYRQCFDGSDEDGCQNYKCPSDRTFKCKSGVCRKASQQCDGFISCPDGSDEEDCQSYTCPNYRPYSCPSGICITLYQLCNGIDDCGDGSDELECEKIQCPEKAFKCNKGNCIPPRYRCNNNNDCDDGEDELDCENYEIQCEHQFACVANDKCIPTYYQCDGHKMCSDGADEKDCPPKGRY